jgi:hypothetical protein
MSREETNKLKYTIALIAEFANRFGIGEKQAYNYLSRFKGLAHLFAFYNVIHTQSFDDAVDMMIQVCAHNGGGLR